MIVTADGMGLITIEWWQLGVIGAGVFLAVLCADRISSYLDVRREQRQDVEHGPYPCLKHLGTEVDGYEWWCWRQHGHEGPHLNQWGVDPSQDLSEPVTISEVAEEMGDTWCPRSSNCRLRDGHPGICHLEYGEQCAGREYSDGHRCLYDLGHEGPHHFGHSTEWPTQPVSEVNGNGDAVVPDTCEQDGCDPGYCPGGAVCRGDMLRKIGE